MIGAILSAVTGLATSWLSNRAKSKERKDRLEEAKVNAKIDRLQSQQTADQEWDRLMAEGSQSSWKDEFWTILLAIPLMMLFWPDPWVNQIAEDGFKRMAEAPDWYVGSLGLAIGAAFGYRKFIKPFMGKKK